LSGPNGGIKWSKTDHSGTGRWRRRKKGKYGRIKRRITSKGKQKTKRTRNISDKINIPPQRTGNSPGTST
jgi:hypothetical protein